MLDFLRGRTGLYVGQEADCRRFVEAVLWISPNPPMDTD